MTDDTNQSQVLNVDLSDQPEPEAPPAPTPPRWVALHSALLIVTYPALCLLAAVFALRDCVMAVGGEFRAMHGSWIGSWVKLHGGNDFPHRLKARIDKPHNEALRGPGFIKVQALNALYTDELAAKQASLERIYRAVGGEGDRDWTPPENL